MQVGSETNSQSEEEVQQYQDSETRSQEEDQTVLTLMANGQMNRRLSVAEAEDNGRGTAESIAAKATGFLITVLRPGWLLGHLDVHSFKVASRTWAHIWISLLLIAIPRSLVWTGSAAYLTVILSCVDSVGGQSIALAAANSMFTLYVATVAFTAQVVANAINWQIRGKPTLLGVATEIFGSGECPMGDEMCFQEVLLDGRYLSTKTTAVTAFGIFFATAAMVMVSNLHKMHLHFRVPLIFAIIFICIGLTFTNHLPMFAPWTVGKVYFIPVFVACAFKMVLAIIWFPISSSCNCTNNVWKLHAKLASTALKLNAMAEKTPLGSEEFEGIPDALATSFDPPPMFWSMLMMDMPLLPLEMLYSRLDPEDIVEFLISARRLTAAQSAFTFFYQEFQDLRHSIINAKGAQRRATNASGRSAQDVHPLNRYTSRRGTGGANTTGADSGYGAWLRKKLNHEYLETGNFESEFQKNTKGDRVRFETIEDVDAIYKAVVAHHSTLLKSVNEAALAVAKWLDDANKFRASALVWPAYRKKRIERQKHFAAAVQDALQRMEDEYRETKRDPHWILGELNRYGSALDENQRAYAIAQDVFYEFLVIRLFDIVRKECRWCVYVDGTRPHATLIKPFAKVKGGKRAAVMAHYSKLDRELDLEELRLPEKTTPFTPKVRNAQRRNPNSTPPRNPFHLVGKWLIRTQHALTSDSAVYCYKKSSCALIPLILFFARPTLRWAYDYRIVWVAIMAGLTSAPRAGDCVYTLVVRTVMTFFGCLFGLVCWYISAGSGLGNAYGFAGCGAAVALILAYTRHFMVLGGIQGKIVLAVTVTLVYGVSYVDGKDLTVTKLTHGWDVAWIRFVTVVVGLVIGFVVTIVPNAETIKKTVRMQMAGLLNSTALIQTEVMNFAIQRYEDDTVHQTIVKDAIIEYLAQSMQSTSVLTLNMASLKYEPPLTGFWPKAHYNLLLRLLKELIYLQANLYATLNKVDKTSEIIDMLTAMGLLDSSILAGTYSSIHMCGTSLKSGQALPAITPGHLAQDHRVLLRQQFGNEQAFELVKALSLQPDGRLLLVSVHTAQLYYRRLDGIMAVVKRLVGEDFGFDAQLNQWITHDHT